MEDERVEVKVIIGTPMTLFREIFFAHIKLNLVVLGLLAPVHLPATFSFNFLVYSLMYSFPHIF